MDLALAIFNIGAGLGVLAAGVSLAYLAWKATPLIRETRGLTADLRRLTRATDTELRPILTHARELTSNVEVLSEDVAVKLDRLTRPHEHRPAQPRYGADHGGPATGERATIEPKPAADVPFWELDPRPEEPRPVESWETREEPSER